MLRTEIGGVMEGGEEVKAVTETDREFCYLGMTWPPFLCVPTMLQTSAVQLKYNGSSECNARVLL